MPAFELRNDSLFQDGKALVCPFVPRFLIPDQLEPHRSHMVGVECGTWCPLFELMRPAIAGEDDLPAIAYLHCGSGKRAITPIEISRTAAAARNFKEN